MPRRREDSHFQVVSWPDAERFILVLMLSILGLNSGTRNELNCFIFHFRAKMSSDEFEDILSDRIPVKMKKLTSDRPPLKPCFKTTRKVEKGEGKMKSDKRDKNNVIPSFAAAMDKSFMSVKEINLIPDVPTQEQRSEVSSRHTTTSPNVDVSFN